MNLKQFLAATIAIVTLSAVGPHARGQSLYGASCLAGWEWNQNSLLQDPCTVVSLLEAWCRGTSEYTVGPLSYGDSYTPPQEVNVYDPLCECDTVTYSLYMACTSCQDGYVYSWETWAAQCIDGVSVAYYPYDVPYGTAIPAWAFYDVTTLADETYSDYVAESVGDYPEATPPYTTSYPPDYTPAPKTVNIAAIVGGAAGGVVFVAALATAVFLIIRRQRRGRGPPPSETTNHIQGPVSAIPPMSPVSPVSRSLSPSTDVASYYNPDDPMKYPGPMGGIQGPMGYPNLPSPQSQYRIPNYAVPEL